MFVGLASRVLSFWGFKAAPAIIFIVKIDAVGRQRGVGLGGGNDGVSRSLRLALEVVLRVMKELSLSLRRSDICDQLFAQDVLIGKVLVGHDVKVVKQSWKFTLKASLCKKIWSGCPTNSRFCWCWTKRSKQAALVAARRNKSVIDASDIDEAEDRVTKLDLLRKIAKTVSKRTWIAAYLSEAGHTIALV